MAGVAFLIGIETYDDEHFDPLTTGYDIDAIAEKLESRNSKYKLIKDPLKGKVTIDELERELIDFLSGQRGDDGLIYFSGHGYQVVDRRGKTPPVGYLATSDCEVIVKDKRVTGQDSGLALSYFNDLIHKSNFKSLVLLLDACHSGQFLEEAIVKASFQPKTTLNYHIIASSLSSQSSYMDDGTVQDLEDEGLSIFTDAFLKGLSKDNAETNGRITSDKLFRSIEERLNNSKYKQQPIQMALYRNSIVLMEYKLLANVPKITIEPIKDKNGAIICPYQGLKTFDEEQKELFFGRERLIKTLREKLRQIAFIPVIGASGSGKSSVVRAGLIPLLREEGWQILKPIKPDRKPLRQLKNLLFNEEFSQHLGDEQLLDDFDENPSPETLEAILRQLQGSKKFLLVVDQFEELFTLNSEENQPDRLKSDRTQFIELITQVARILDSPLAVVITMRADFIEPCLHYPVLHELIQNHAVFMPPLVGEDLIDAIEKPAQRQGYQVEPKLVTDLAAEVSKEPGSLPLLEFALTQLWEQRDEQGKMLTYAAYTKLGGEVPGYEEKSGLKRALNLHANRVYEFWVDDDDAKDKNKPKKPRQDYEKEWIKRIFLRLVRTGQGMTDTRQRQPKANLLMIAGKNEQKQQELARLIDNLVKGRLLVTGEADIGQLEQPDNQLNSEEFQKLAQENQIVDLAHEALIDGWQQFAKWREEDRDLRRLSERLEDARLEWEKDRKDENLEKQHKNRNLMMGGLLAHVRSQWDALQPYLRFPEADENFYKLSATHEQERIEELERALTESRLRLQANYVERLVAVNQPLESLTLAIQTVGENLEKLPDKSIGVVQASLRQVVEKIYTSPAPYGHSSYVNSVAISPDGQTIVSGSSDNTIRLWKLDGTPIGNPFAGHTSSVSSVAISPDGQTIASGSRDYTIRLWKLDGTPIGNPFAGHTSSVSSVAISPDGQTIVSGSNDNTIRLWKLDGTPIGNPFTGHTDWVSSVAISPDGQTIVSGSEDNTIRIFSSVGWQTWLQVCCQRLHNNWTKDPQGVAYKTCLMEKARSLSEAGDLDAAIVYFQKALRITSGCQLSSEALETEAKRKIAPTLLAQGEKLARSANYEGAVAKFKQAIEFDDKLTLDPETKAKQLTTPILLMQGTFDALGLDINSAIAKFNQAKALDSTLDLDPEREAKRLATSVLIGQGEKLAEEGDSKNANAKFKQAKKLDPSLKIPKVKD